MAEITLKSLLRPKADGVAFRSVLDALGGAGAVEDASGQLLAGSPQESYFRSAVRHGDAVLGWISGPKEAAEAAGALLTHLAARESERKALAGEVLQLYREVHLIDQLSQELTAVLQVTGACETALAHARPLIPASAGGILVRSWEGGELAWAAQFGEVSQLPEPQSERLAGAMERGLGEIVNAGEATNTASLIFAPLRAKQRSVGLIVMADGAGLSYTAANLKLLNTIALQIAAAIKNSYLCAANGGGRAVPGRTDGDSARTGNGPHDSAFDGAEDFSAVSAPDRFRTARADDFGAPGGCRFFNYFLIDEEHLGLVIGDVSGKGTPSALFMAVTHTHVETVAFRSADPAACMKEVNRILVTDKATSMYATCFYGILHTPTGELKYCCAGHNPPYRISTDGEVTALECEGGLPLGLFPGEYTSGSVRLAPGESLYLSTDGVSEANNAALEEFGDESLMAVLKSAAGLSPRALIDEVNGQLKAFCAGAPQSDDITMVAVRVGK